MNKLYINLRNCIIRPCPFFIIVDTKLVKNSNSCQVTDFKLTLLREVDIFITFIM